LQNEHATTPDGPPANERASGKGYRVSMDFREYRRRRDEDLARMKEELRKRDAATTSGREEFVRARDAQIDRMREELRQHEDATEPEREEYRRQLDEQIERMRREREDFDLP